MQALKILYVEDEPDIRSIGRIAMEAVGGFTVCECDSGFDACDKVQTFQPDLMILDMMMPGLNGLETLARLHDLPHMANVPVVFMTAKVQQAEISHYLNHGALDVIAKPFNPLHLPVQIQAIWAAYLAGQPQRQIAG